MNVQVNSIASTKTRKKQPTGFVFYRGPSLIDGKPIVGICLVGKSSNVKTGTMVQTYILRSDVHPVESVKTGSDVSICGSCPHRLMVRDYYDRKSKKVKNGLKRTCYVNLGHGPTAVFSGLMRGIYPSVNPVLLSKLKGRMLRLGTYGDPAAIPQAYWNMLLNAEISGHTGYTHQWQTSLGDVWIGRLMASVDNATERLKAWKAGWKTFAVLNTSETHTDAQSATCPSSKEYTEKTGKKVQCADCKLCNGSKAHVAIQGHGIGWVDQPFQSQRISLV
jgi:hypothetical protein